MNKIYIFFLITFFSISQTVYAAETESNQATSSTEHEISVPLEQEPVTLETLKAAIDSLKEAKKDSPTYKDAAYLVAKTIRTAALSLTTVYLHNNNRKTLGSVAGIMAFFSFLNN